MYCRTCETCRQYKGDCGHHYKDSDGHIHYNVPSVAFRESWGGCIYYEDVRSGVEIALEELAKSDISGTSKVLLFSCVQQVLKAEGKCVFNGRVVDQKTGKPEGESEL